MKAIAGVILGLVLIGSTGCATVMRGKNQGMQFNTEPQGATVVLSDGKSSRTFVTPAKVEMARKEKHTVEISKPGYRTVKFEMEPQWDGAAIGNVIMPGGSVGAAADTANGADRAFYKLDTVTLTKAESASEPPIQMAQHRGKLYTQEEYLKVIAEEEEHRKAMSAP